ncbi:hypothetical protein SAMN04488510_101123 [Fervidobacterium changbaicum]|uniref:Uncharacterized protein n=2 Tax=Fervidobacterium TaxID=2422 RepID=A0AAI8CL30_FERIS|nr:MULTISPECIES: hypothetical protein [Fervidobacterium]AMW33362.1 hypothetical protein NA23_09015 [Fervidobacterium islandicum]QAV33424.1 hypothetical protein CBS1_06660 [Fervidobacterium changbaicum]SDG92317.1 hypothetical protein SAMN04488510_101123 [Fervidobacterium changbaicum]
MLEKTDKSFFKKFPIGYALTLAVGVALLYLDFSFVSILKDYMTIVDFTRIGLSIILIASGIFEIIAYLFSFVPTSRYDKNIEELKTIVVNQIREKGHSVLGEFLSFRPWMESEYYAKSRRGVTKYFYPVYYVVLSTANNVLYVTEVRLNILNKSFHMVGYNILPLKSIISAGVVQDRILFSTLSGEDAATTYFLEVRTIGGVVRIPVFEEEISSKFGDIRDIRDDVFRKLTLTVQLLTQQKSS